MRPAGSPAAHMLGLLLVHRQPCPHPPARPTSNLCHERRPGSRPAPPRQESPKESRPPGRSPGHPAGLQVHVARGLALKCVVPNGRRQRRSLSPAGSSPQGGHVSDPEPRHTSSSAFIRSSLGPLPTRAPAHARARHPCVGAQSGPAELGGALRQLPQEHRAPPARPALFARFEAQHQESPARPARLRSFPGASGPPKVDRSRADRAGAPASRERRGRAPARVAWARGGRELSRVSLAA